MVKRIGQWGGGGILFLFAQTRPLEACAVCFGAAGDAQTKGVVYGVFTLLVILLIVLGLFSTFFFNLRKRAQKIF